MYWKKLSIVIVFAVAALLVTACFALGANGSNGGSMPDIVEATELLKSELITNPGFVGISHFGDRINVYLVNEESGRDVPDDYMGYPVKKIVTGEISSEN